MKNLSLITDTKKALSEINSNRKTVSTISALKRKFLINPTQANRLGGMCLLFTIEAWEQFLQSVFTKYACGTHAPNGSAPSLLQGPYAKLADARKNIFDILNPKRKGKFDEESQFITIPPSQILPLARKMFVDGKPFSSCIDDDIIQQLKTASTIRNRVAHRSVKCKIAFKTIAIKHLRGIGSKDVYRRRYNSKKDNREKLAKPESQYFIRQGLSSWDLLSSDSTGTFKNNPKGKTLFDAYMELFERLVAGLAPRAAP